MHHVKQGVIAVFRRLAETMREPPLLAAPGVDLLLDPALTLLPGDLAVVGARSQAQAEQVLLRIAAEFAVVVKPSRHVLVVADDVDRVMVQLLAREARVSVRAASDPSSATPQERTKLARAAETLNAAPIEFEAASIASTWKFVLEWLARHPYGIAFLPAAWPVADRSYESAARFVRDAKAIARDTNATIVLPWRLKADTSRPLLTDLLGCGAIEDDADLILLVDGSEWRVTNVSLAKNRHGPLEGIVRTAAPMSDRSAPTRRVPDRVRHDENALSAPSASTTPAQTDEHLDHRAPGVELASTTGLDDQADAALVADVLALLADRPLKAKQLVRLLSRQGRTVSKTDLNRVLYRSVGTVPGLTVSDGVWRVDRG